TIASAWTPLSVRPALCIVTVSPVTSNTARSTDSCTDGPWSWRWRPMNGPPSNSRVRAKRVTSLFLRHCEPPQVARPSGAVAGIALDGFASLAMTNRLTSPQHRPNGYRLAAQEVALRHRRLAGALDRERPDCGIAAGDRELVIQHGSRRAVAAADACLQHLDPLPVEFEPGAGEGGEGADLAFDQFCGLGPVDAAFGLVDLGGVCRAQLGLRLRLELVELRQRVDHEPSS